MLSFRRIRHRRRLLCALALIAYPAHLSAVLPSGRPLLPNYDKRAGKQAQIAAELREALGQLRARVQDVKVDFDVVTGSARWVRSGEGFLSGQNGQGGGISAGAIARWPQADPHRILKAFLEEHSKLFGHGAEVLEGAQLKRQFITPHNWLQT